MHGALLERRLHRLFRFHVEGVYGFLDHGVEVLLRDLGEARGRRRGRGRERFGVENRHVRVVLRSQHKGNYCIEGK